MDSQNKYNLITYTIKKNHLPIYEEFLEFQSLNSEPHKSIPDPQLEQKQASLINRRNFQALYWIVLYLKDLKGNSLQLIYDFFIDKNWTTWSFKNFSYHYYKLIKSEQTKDELQQLKAFLNREENLMYGTLEESQNSKNEQITKPTTQHHRPIIVGDYSNNNETAIHINSSLAESQERLKRAREKLNKA